MSRHVTVGVDGAPESGAAADWAAREALVRKVPLRIVHAYEWSGAGTNLAGPDEPRRWADELLAEVAEELQRGHPSLEISTRLLSGQPAAALAAEADEADLLVLGSRGLSGVMGFLLGSVGRQTISMTEQPVVLVRMPGQAAAPQVTAPPRPARDVVVGVDINQLGDPLLAFGFEESARHRDRLLALYGWSIPPVVRDSAALLAAQREVSEDVARRLTEILAPWRRKFPSVQVVERSPVGSPSQLLVDAAADADLVVVGRCVRKAILGTRIGSVAQAVIHHCAAPVVVVAYR
ncbi:universal stress protein [Streptomyces sp. NPDC057438]|uniref:universal stress protein n=1 Tax=Streptomyces sp. NPDC057438 TaxID=3346133 RepID=UPI0036A8E879